MNTTLYSKDRQASQPSFAVGFSDTARDEALVAAAMMGEEKAFETLVTRYQPRIFALALRSTRIREDAEDVVHLYAYLLESDFLIPIRIPTKAAGRA